MKEVKQLFLTGLFTLLPAVILVALILWVYRFLRDLFFPVLTVAGLQANLFFLVLVVVITFLLILLIGAAVRTRAGKSTFSFIENGMLNLIPGYKQVRKITHSFRGEQIKNASSVVLVDIMQNGTYMTGFVTDKPTKDRTTVFVPTGPNPTSGLIYHVSDKFVKATDASPQEAFESILAVGKHSSILFSKEKK